MQYRDQFMGEGLERIREGQKLGGETAGRGRAKDHHHDSSVVNPPQSYSEADSPETEHRRRKKTRAKLAQLAGVPEFKIQQTEAVQLWNHA